MFSVMVERAGPRDGCLKRWLATVSAMRTVGLAVSDGVSLFELAAPVAVLGADRPPDVADWYDLQVCGPSDARVGSWLRVADAHGYDALLSVDTIVIPACHDGELRPPPELVEVVHDAYERGARVMSICTGAFVLAEAGLLDGRRATTHWKAARVLQDRYPRVTVDPRALYIDEDRVLTSAGKAAGMDLMLHVVRRDFGARAVNHLARHLVTAPHRDGGQAQFIDRAPRRRAAGLAPVLDWAIAHLEDNISVGTLASRANMTTRTLNRRFRLEVGDSPLQWLHRQRIHKAQQLLEDTDDTIESIAHACGFATTEAFRRQFAHTFGTRPSDYRRLFRSTGSPRLAS